MSEDDDVTLTLSADISPKETISIAINISQRPYTDGEILYVGANQSTGNESRSIMMLISDNQEKDFTIELH